MKSRLQRTSGAPARGDPPSPSGDTAAPRSGLLRLANNLITLAGLWLVAVGLVLILTFALFRAITPTHNPYLDIIGYLVLPGILVGGLVLCPLGMVLAKWRRRGARTPRMIPLRWVAAFFGTSFFVILPLLGVSGYHGYQYTESTQFCSTTCHAVMEPQATAYSYSPHARVACAECHIGAGASPFVKSKLSGLRQVWAVMADTYHRPIPPAITELRPARDTCEECHWPAKFFGDQLKTLVHFSQNETNTRREVRLLVKTGGADEALGLKEGIHMHMLARIEYVATDDTLQEIPWVSYTDDSAAETIYRDDDLPATSPPPAGTRRELDCMDCHNRGAHKFASPQEALDQAMSAGLIDPALPYIKREVVKLLSTDYPTSELARSTIAERITEFYRLNYPEIWDRSRNKSIPWAIDAAQKIHARNWFPSMQADWRTYPENIGHLDSPGCFRCHDGRHVNHLGQSITSACAACHSFLNRSPGTNALMEGDYEHSFKLHESWQGFGPHAQMRCDDCHNGGLLMSCEECHGSGKWLEQRGQGRFRPQARPPDTRISELQLGSPRS